MDPFLSDPDLTLYLGDAHTVLAELPDRSVHTCATSPPFFGLRDYGVEDQIGLEDDLEGWVASLVDVFAEVRRVLRDDGTLWVEVGDSYATEPAKGRSGQGKNTAYLGTDETLQTRRPISQGLKAKDLTGQPWRLAFALQAEGWWLRSCVIWHKPNCMPESATDRPTTAHSYVFLFAKSSRYYFDADAIREPAEWSRWGDQTTPKYEGEEAKGRLVKPLTKEQIAKRFGGGRTRKQYDAEHFKTTEDRNTRFQGPAPGEGQMEEGDALFAIDDRETVSTKRPDGWASHEGGHGTIHQDGRENGAPALLELDAVAFRNSRSVWSIATEPNGNAICSVCGAFWAGNSPKTHCETKVIQHYAAFPRELVRRMIVAGAPAGGTVLDPFAGSGTTLLVARAQGRKAIGIELNESYAKMILARTQQQTLLA